MIKKSDLLKLEEKAQAECIKYYHLSSLFFKNDDIYNVNEIPESNEFYKSAKDMAAELEIDWEKMSHEDSNRIVINLLADQFLAIMQDPDYKHEANIMIKMTPKVKS